MVKSVFICLKACQHLGLQEAGMWFTLFPFVWSVLELVKILELRQSVNVIGFLIRSFPAISDNPCASPRSRLSDFRLRGGSQTGCSELILCPQG